MSVIVGDDDLTPQQRLRAAAQQAFTPLYGNEPGRPINGDEFLALLEVVVTEIVTRVKEAP
jgi:hypothetical protein